MPILSILHLFVFLFGQSHAFHGIDRSNIVNPRSGEAGGHADLLLTGLPRGRGGERQVLREQPRAHGGGLPPHDDRRGEFSISTLPLSSPWCLLFIS